MILAIFEQSNQAITEVLNSVSKIQGNLLIIAISLSK